MGIPNVGKKIAKQIAKIFAGKNSHEEIFAKLFSVSEEELLEIPDIGPETARGFVNFMENNREIVENFIAELTFEKTETVAMEGERLLGKSFCVTGSFEGISRDEIHEKIEQNGGEVRSSVSAKLDFLIAGEKAGSKLAKAEELGVKVLSLEEFMETIS